MIPSFSCTKFQFSWYFVQNNCTKFQFHWYFVQRVVLGKRFGIGLDVDKRQGLSPDWDQLYELASAQEGYFTIEQAREVGISAKLLSYHQVTGKLTRPLRGIYRLVHFPYGDQDELVIAWLWTERAGVISHESALAAHRLSDVLPSSIELTLPESWRARRLRVPDGISLHYGDVAPQERVWVGSVIVTSPRRTLNDCARDGLSPELLRQAAQQALQRRLVTQAELGPVIEALYPFGGVFL